MLVRFDMRGQQVISLEVVLLWIIDSYFGQNHQIFLCV